MKKVFGTLVRAILCCFMLFAFVGCGEKKESTQSTLCGIEEAYANGLISKDDLRNIAYYYNGKDGTIDFILIPKTPESLSGDTIRKIKQTYYDKVTDGKSEATVDDVNIAGYYGTYNGCVVVEINASCVSGIGGDPLYYPEYRIGDVIFHSYTPLQVWKETRACSHYPKCADFEKIFCRTRREEGEYWLYLTDEQRSTAENMPKDVR